MNGDLVAKLGEGSMASVYRAEDRVRGCLVAVKVMRAHHLDDPATYRRFRREAESLARLEHPHVVRLYELVTEAESPFLVVDYIEGQSVAQLLEERQGEPLPLVQATRILYEIGGALHFAHQQGILHRDIKPSNILLDRSGKAYLADFGIALLSDRTRLTHDRTEPGVGPGTPVYMAPEQWLGEEPDARTDVYALGALLYELLTGRPPFVSNDPGVLAYQHLQVPPMPPSQRNTDIPRRVDHVILKALAKKRDKRYSDAATMLKALHIAEEASKGRSPVLSKRPPRVRRVLRLLVLSVGAILMLLAILVGLILLGPWQWPLGVRSETTHRIGLGTMPVVISLSGAGTPVPLVVTPTHTLTPTPSLTVLSTPTPSPTVLSTPTPSPSPSPSPSLTPRLSPTPFPSPTQTPSPLPSSTPTPTPTPYLAVGDERLNVYAGPGKGYEVLGEIRRGDRLPILGRSEDGEWWQVDYLGWRAWIAAQSVIASVELQAVPVAEAPPMSVNQRPSIQEVQVVSTTIETWSTMTLTCQASDPDGDVLTYDWETSGGSITDSGISVTYHAPDSSGSQAITITVRDGYGGEAERAILIQVVSVHPPPGMSEPVGVFGQIWHEAQLRRTLGWATGGESTVYAAQQFFEKGVMFWREDNEDIYVLLQNGSREVRKSHWGGAADEYSCPDIAPRNTPPTPKRGFGDVWCHQLGGPNAAIGWATTAEEGYDANWQTFEHGLMWQGKDGEIYVFYEDKTWETPLNASSLALTIDSFESYDDDAALNEVYNVNDGWVNVGVLGLASPPNVSSGNRGAAFFFQIGGQQVDYSGFGRTFDAQDWRAYNGFRVWIKKSEGIGTRMVLVIQFREAGGEVWKYRTDLSSFDVRDFWIPFDEEVWEYDYWSNDPLPGENERIDLEAIDHYGFFVHSDDPGSGWIYVDDIRLTQ